MPQPHENDPGRFNTDLERNILKSSRVIKERFEKRKLKISEKNPQLASEMLWLPRTFDDDGRVKHTTDGRIWVSSLHDKISGEDFFEETAPKDVKEVERIWREHPHLPNAIRAVRAIKGRYEFPGQEVQQIDQAIRFFQVQIGRFRRHEYTAETIGELPYDAANVLVASRLDNAKKPGKRELALALTEASFAYDARNQFNPAVNELRMNYALLKALPLILENREIYGKNAELDMKLTREFMFQEFYLKEGARLITDLKGLKPRTKAYENGFAELRKYVTEFFADNVVTAAPFRKAAFLTRLAVAGPVTGHEREDLKEMDVKSEEITRLFGGEDIKFKPGNVRWDVLWECYGMLNEATFKARELLESGEAEETIEESVTEPPDINNPMRGWLKDDSY